MIYRFQYTAYIRSGFDINSILSQADSEAKECVNKAIFNRNIQSKGNSGDLCNVEYALYGFGVENGVVNYNGENFKNLISDVKEVLSKNNLPESKLCVKTIAWSLLEGTKDTEYLKSKRESNKEKGLSLEKVQ